MNKSSVAVWCVVALLLLLASRAGAGEILSEHRTCHTPVYISPTGTDAPAALAPATMTANGTAGRVLCARVTMQCTVPLSTLIWRVQTGAAGATCAAAIYNATGTTLLAATPENTTCTANNQTRTGAVTPITLNAGTTYLGCLANSGTTVAFGGSGTSYALNAGLTTPTVVIGATEAANLAQFNDDCTGAAAPYACCTAADTGTCPGMPASLGTLAVPSNGLPFLAGE